MLDPVDSPNCIVFGGTLGDQDAVDLRNIVSNFEYTVRRFRESRRQAFELLRSEDVRPSNARRPPANGLSP